jgi:DNA-binding beta-propeller fold protein YncE
LKKITALVLAVLICFTAVIPAATAGIVPYDSYTYDFWANIVFTPAPYVPGRTVSGLSLGVGSFRNPQDLTMDSQGRIYVADTDNDRIVVMNPEMTRAVKVIQNDKTVADSYNTRITSYNNAMLGILRALDDFDFDFSQVSSGQAPDGGDEDSANGEGDEEIAIEEAAPPVQQDESMSVAEIITVIEGFNINIIGSDDVAVRRYNSAISEATRKIRALTDAARNTEIEGADAIAEAFREANASSPLPLPANFSMFNRPMGVTICPMNDWLYVADFDKLRVVAIEVDFNGDNDRIVRTLDDPRHPRNPGHEMLDEGWLFNPQRVAVDYAGRVYVIARSMFQGIMVFNQEDLFTGFFGTINVTLSTWERFWRIFETQEQRANRRLFLPTEFTGIDLDDNGFIYASNFDTSGMQAVRRLNPTGADVIRRGENENLGGDLEIRPINEFAGPSQIVDVVYRGRGIYSLLDRLRGRIFTYDREGNLLYIFGGLGTTAGTFSTPVAIEMIGESIAVLDSSRGEIITFDATLYGELINEAVGLRFDGDESLAVEKWRQVLLLNENLEIANVGIGKAYLTAGDNVSAMHYLRLGQSRSFYSIAYRRYRNDVLRNNMSWILSGVLLAALAIPITYKIRKRKRVREGIVDE